MIYFICFILRYACDRKVICLLRERGLGNSSTRLQQQLKEQHGEHWLRRTLRYLTECENFVNRPGIQEVPFQEPPQPLPVPTFRWLLHAYTFDILQRVDAVKAQITSTYGRILKMDSSKKVF